MPNTHDLSQAQLPRSPQEHYSMADELLRDVGRMEDADHDVHQLPKDAQLLTIQLMVAIAQVHATLATVR